MSAPENRAKAMLGVRKTEIVGENGLKPQGFHWKFHYRKTCDSRSYLAASCSECPWHERTLVTTLNR